MEKSKKKSDNRQFAVNCTAMFVIISIVNVIISFIAAKYICIYTGNTLVPYYVLLACIFIGLEILLYFFTVPLASGRISVKTISICCFKNSGVDS